MSFSSSLPEYLVYEMDITPEELARRKSFLNFGVRDIELLMELQRFVRGQNMEAAFSDAFYQHLTAFPELLRFLPDRATVERLKKLQAKYFQELINGNYDNNYALNRLKVGHTHQSVGLDPKWYTGAYREYLSLLIPILHEMADGDLARFEETYNAVLKVVFFDMQLALDTYFHSDRKELRRLATHDVLTGLPNRRLFHERLAQELDNAGRNRQRFALLLVDLDGFKEVNDALGHAVGDRLLIEAARRVREVAGGHNTVARVGGDEFMIILPFMPDPSIAEGIAERIISKLTVPYHLDTEIAYLSASAGIAFYPHDADSVSGLVTSADQAMHESKRKGKGRWCRFTREFQEVAQHRIRLTHDLRSALAENQFRVHYQPIVDLASGHIYKAEALVRWLHPERGMVPPAEFIPIAESTGLIHEIGDWVFKESARWARRWTEVYSANFKISVNESPVQFMDRQISINVSPAQFETESLTFAENWLNHLNELGLSGENVVVEITEGLLLHADPDILDKLLKLRDSGIQVAIDDFGTGYSSLSYLRKFDIDYLKIDQTFVRDLATSVNDQTLCQAIIVMAHTLGLKVIAEGVETEAQRDILIAAGCDYAQGYLFARPLPPEEFERLFAQPFPS